MARRGTLALFGAAFGLTLIATAPASLLGASLKAFTRGVLDLRDTQGTVWRGAAIPVFHSGDGKLVPFEQVRWKVSPASIFLGRIDLDVGQGSSSQFSAARVEISRKGIELRHVSFALPAELLEAAHPLLQAMHPQGSLHITSEQLTLAGDTLQGSAAASWLSAGSTFSSVNPFGNYQLSLNASGTQVAIALVTISGPLLLDGQGTWSKAKGLTIEAHAKASKENQDALSELLHHLGPEIEPGTRLLRIGSAI